MDQFLEDGRKEQVVFGHDFFTNWVKKLHIPGRVQMRRNVGQAFE